MRTQSAERENWHCPRCGDETTQDPAGKRFVRHKTNSDCGFERGERDADG